MKLAPIIATSTTIHRTLNTPLREANEKLQKAIGELGNLKLTQKRPGCAIWVEGDTQGFEKKLGKLGFNHSEKRDQYFMRVMNTY